MAKLTNELISKWVANGEHFEMRGDGDGLYLSLAKRYPD
jgi:hypothetical protein